MLRLGDGTEESHNKIQTAVNELWTYTGELYTPNQVETEMAEAGIAAQLDKLKTEWLDRVSSVLKEATLTVPEQGFMQVGGKEGRHTEHLGFILAEMQIMQRTYPGAEW
ncbi:MAG: Phenylacetic acid catabolic protein [Saprospiraceae bacterium]